VPSGWSPSNTAEGWWSRDVSEDVANEVLDRAFDADETPTDGTKLFVERAPADTVGAAWARSGDPQEVVSRIDFCGPRPDTGVMGVRTRGLDIKAGAAKLKVERVALLSCEPGALAEAPF
jgi:hypothetical protein